MPYNEDHERKIKLLTDERVKNRKYLLLDARARIIGRMRIPEMGDKNCLIITTGDGETMVLTESFERELLHTLRNKE